MTREKRKRNLHLKPFLDKLEMRRLMSASAADERLAHSLARAATVLESQLSGGDFGGFAQELAQRPRVAADLGLGDLSRALRQHAGYADRHGWKASLVSVLTAHPRYAAAHHLTAALSAPESPSISPTNQVSPRSQTIPTKTIITPRNGAAVATEPTTNPTTQAAALQELESAFAKAAASHATPPTVVAPTATAPISPAAPSVVLNDPLSVGIGGALDVTLPNLGLGTSGLTFTITPQPLPDNVTFNRQTGELVFTPAPGQQGEYDFSVAVSNGSQNGLITVPITVTAPALASTELSGQVVDENGDPLPDMPVTVAGISTITNSSGNFTLTGVPANPGPISAGGSVGTAQGRLDLTAPVAQLLGHDLYADADNVIPSPLILPLVNWSNPASFSQVPSATSVNITTSAMPGLSVQMPVSASALSAATGTVQVAVLPAALSVQHMAPGTSSPLVLLNISGSNLTSSVQLTLPNIIGLQAGAIAYLTMFNPITGGHNVVGRLVVSDDGETMTSSGMINLSTNANHAQSGLSSELVTPDDSPSFSPSDTVECLGVEPTSPTGGPIGTSSSSWNSSSSSSSSSSSTTTTSCNCSNSLPGGGTSGGPVGGGGPKGIMVPAGVMDSDAGLVSGAYLLNNQLMTYQAQGQTLGINLQYSSAQADPTPVVQYQFTTPINGDSSSISSITAQVSIGGVESDPVTYNTVDLADGDTYDVPLQVDASELPTGVYTYTMNVTEDFGTEDITAVSFVAQGTVNVVNESSDPLGAGWSIGGLQQLSQLTTDGPVLITDGQEGTEAFQPAYTEGQDYVQDLALATTTSAVQILPNDGLGNFSATVSATDSVMGSAAGIFTSSGEQDLAVVSESALQIELNNGTGGFTAGGNYTIPSGYSAKGVVVGNFSNHGNVDIAVLLQTTTNSITHNTYAVAVYIGNGDGTFEDPVITAVDGTSFYTNSNFLSWASHNDDIITGDFTGGSETDLAFVSDNNEVAILFPTSDGAMSAATELSLPADHYAVGITTADYNDDGYTDVIVEANNTMVHDSAGDFACLDVYEGDGSGDLSYTGSTYQTVGHASGGVLGLAAGYFQGSSMGLEIAAPVSGDTGQRFIDIVPISSSATMGPGTLHFLGDGTGSNPSGNIVAADFNGSGKPSIAMTDGSDNIWLLLSDPASNQFLPVEDIVTGSKPGMLVVAPFDETPATAVYRSPTSDPSTLIQNDDGSWTRTYPDGTVIQFNAAGQETSESDRNSNTYTYTYVTTGLATGALASITDPVGLVTVLDYDEYGHISTITNPDSFVTNFTVDGYGNLTGVEDPLGDTWDYGYATPSNHEATSETDPNGNTASAVYNSFGQLTSETLYDGTSTTSIDPAQTNGLLAPDGSGSLSTNYGTSFTEPDGQTTTLTLNRESQVTERVAPNGGVTTITYDKYGFPSDIAEPLGRGATYTYNAAGEVTSVNFYGPDGAEGNESMAYGADGVLSSITDFDGNITTFTLDSHGNVTEQQQPGGVDQEWTYNSAGQVLTYEDGDGGTTTYSYDDLGRIEEVQLPGPGSPTVDYEYLQIFGLNVVGAFDADGNGTGYAYNAMGEVVIEANPPQVSAGVPVQLSYDGDGNLTSVTDANGNTTYYAYDARDELTSVTDALGNTTSYGYDGNGNVLTVTDALGGTTTYTYTPENQIATMTDPTSGTTTYGYDIDGELTAVTDPTGGQVTYSYSPRGFLTGESETAVTGDTVVPVATYTYDKDGDLLTAKDGDGHTTSYTYNALNELTSAQNRDGDTTSYTYDGDGNVLTVKDGLGHTTSYTYNAMNQVLTEAQPSGGGTTSYTYDPAGLLVGVTDPDDNKTTYAYDVPDDVVTQESPTGGLTTDTYDLAGNLVSQVDPDGHEIDYAYDADNELTSETWDNPEGGTPLDVIDYTYDADGELTGVSDDNSAYEYTYNADGEVTSQSDAGSPDLPLVTLMYDYDPDGNETSMDDSLGGLASYTYNARDELTNETLSGTDISPMAVADTYDNAGNMTGQTRYSDLAETDVVASTSYTYDAANQMTGITDKNSGGTTLVSYGYTYNAAGLVSQETRTWASGADTDTLTYGYTANDQLTSVTHTNHSFANESFSWDANGNETGTGYTTSTGNEQTASPGYTYTYDADGNSITETDTSTGDTWTYSYNFWNQMTGAVETDSEDTVIEQVTHTYDALGNRIGIDDNGTQTWTLYDTSSQVAGSSPDTTNPSALAAPVMDFSGSGSLETLYLTGTTGQLVDAVIGRESAGGSVAWYLPDRLGTIPDLINNSGSIIDHVDYSAFGAQLDESAPSEGDRMMGFAGMERDTAVALNLAIDRVQNPVTGRWTSQDPLGFSAGDADLYRYVGNGPTQDVDPLGLCDCDNGDWGGGGQSGTVQALQNRQQQVQAALFFAELELAGAAEAGAGSAEIASLAQSVASLAALDAALERAIGNINNANQIAGNRIRQLAIECLAKEIEELKKKGEGDQENHGPEMPPDKKPKPLLPPAPPPKPPPPARLLPPYHYPGQPRPHKGDSGNHKPFVAP